MSRRLGDDLAVSCCGCHRGKLRPATTLPLLTERPSAPSTAVNATPASKQKAMRADDVLKRLPRGERRRWPGRVSPRVWSRGVW